MELSLPRCLCFDRTDDTARTPRPRQAKSKAPRPERWLLCARCRHPITTQEQRLAVNGAFEHDFTNPHGLQFHIAGFRDAPGCAAVGAATLEHTWFPGYAWRIAVCGGCDAHLGWKFSASVDAFYGLIVGQLIEDGN